jgi:uncharacterized protein (DUF2336 family)
MTSYASLLTELEHAVAQGSTQRRRDMLLQVADFFIAGSARFSDQEIDFFDDVLARLTVEIESAARALLADRLAPVANAPRGITKVLATDDDIRVAYPILIRSDRLDEDTLVRAAQTKTQQHLLAISRRKSLSEPITDVLIERGEDQVVLSVVRNKGARFSDAGFSRLVGRANDNDAIAESFGMRADIPHDVFLRLLETASNVVRRKLIRERPYAKAEIENMVAAATEQVHQDWGTGSLTDAARGRIRALHEAGKLDQGMIREFAESDMFEEATASLALLCDVPTAMVAQAIVEQRLETLIVFARAARLSWSTTQALLLSHARFRRRSPQKVEQYLASFERLKPETAKQIIEFHRIPVDQRHGRAGATKRRQ